MASYWIWLMFPGLVQQHKEGERLFRAFESKLAAAKTVKVTALAHFGKDKDKERRTMEWSLILAESNRAHIQLKHFLFDKDVPETQITVSDGAKVGSPFARRIEDLDDVPASHNKARITALTYGGYLWFGFVASEFRAAKQPVVLVYETSDFM